MKKLIPLFVIALGTLIIISGACKKKPFESLRSADPFKDGYVPDEVTAVQVAEAIWLPLFGDAIYDKKPFRAELKNDSVWIVQGTLGRNEVGGVPYAEIQKRDCRIMSVIHTK